MDKKYNDLQQTLKTNTECMANTLKSSIEFLADKLLGQKKTRIVTGNGNF